MDKKINNDMGNEKYVASELLDFLDDDDTYLVVDNETGIVGNKKTGIMIDKRTGRVFCEGSNKNLNQNLKNTGVKYDFLDYRKSVDILNDSEKLELCEKKDITENRSLSNQSFKLRNYLGKNFPKKNSVNKKEEVLKQDIDKEPLCEVKDEKIEVKDSSLIDINTQTDEEILKKINEKFKSIEGEFSEFRDDNFSNSSSDDYSFSSFENYELESEKKNHEEDINSVKDIKSAELEKFKRIMDFEEYLITMPDDESVLKSPFDNIENYEVPKVVVKQEEEDDDSFMPFDVLPDFEVEEIQSYDVNGEEIIKDGMIPDFDLNQGMSKKVSIREVIKNKQKKKQEQKEIQEKLFFETIDERIEQFKKIKEHSIDSQEILNAINMDLNKINSSIRIEFESLNKKRKVSRNKQNRSLNSKPKDDKFSLQNLLEEIYEEKGEKPVSLDVNELDIDSIKKDLAKKERDKNIVN